MTAKILLVDDEALLRRSLKHRLTREGYAVVTAEDAQQALTLARVDQPNLILKSQLQHLLSTRRTHQQ